MGGWVVGGGGWPRLVGKQDGLQGSGNTRHILAYLRRYSFSVLIPWTSAFLEYVIL